VKIEFLVSVKYCKLIVDNPEENNPDNYNEETGFPCICGMFQPKNK